MRITERPNPASQSLDQKSALQIVRTIHREDSRIASALSKVLPQIARAVDIITTKLAQGGRLVYLGAGSSGRQGVLDAAECGPTFGTNRILGVMAGAPAAMFRASESSEDDPKLGARDLRRIQITRHDVLVGISASGRTPYVMGGMRYARKQGAVVIALTCNPAGPMSRLASLRIGPVVGPEVIAGSTRMKAGTAQKLVLNMLSTASMVRSGLVFSGRMINMQLTNRKLRERGCDILVEMTGCSLARALRAIRESGGRLPVAALMVLHDVPRRRAERLLKESASPVAAVRAALDSRRTTPKS